MSFEGYRIRKLAHFCEGRDRLLDLGWAQQPNPYLHNSEVIGLDLERPEPPANYAGAFEGDVMNLPHPFEPESFDAIHAGELLEHLEDPIRFLRNCLDTLKPGGILVLSTPNPNSPWERLLTLSLSRRFFYTEHHVCLYPQRWLIRMLERSGFTDVRLLSGGIQSPFGLVPFPRPWCYQTIAIAKKRE